MKNYILLAATAMIGLSACAPEAEDKVENAYEDRSDALENRADAVRAAADKKADALENRAEKMDNMAEPMGDKVEDGTLDASNAMPPPMEAPSN